MVKSVSTAREQLSKPCRKLLQMRPNVTAQYKKPKSSIARALLDYLTSDSFMYGPLLSPPPNRPALFRNNGAARDSHHNSPLNNEEDAGGSIVTSSNTPPTRPSSTLHRMSTFTRRFLWRATANNDVNGGEVAPTASEVLHEYREETIVGAPFKNNKKVVYENEGNADGNLTDIEAGDDDESSKSFTESQTENDVTPLDKEAAMEIGRRLVRKVGGRYSKELGIFVDIRDSEAERWFLATTFLSHPSDFELAKHMFKKLQSMGISKIQDVLGIDQRELEEAFQNVMHNRRIASRLQKIALGLRSEHGGGVCTLKRTADYAELKRDLENLPGYSKTSARTFLSTLGPIEIQQYPYLFARLQLFPPSL